MSSEENHNSKELGETLVNVLKHRCAYKGRLPLWLLTKELFSSVCGICLPREPLTGLTHSRCFINTLMDGPSSLFWTTLRTKERIMTPIHFIYLPRHYRSPQTHDLIPPPFLFAHNSMNPQSGLSSADWFFCFFFWGPSCFILCWFHWIWRVNDCC